MIMEDLIKAHGWEIEEQNFLKIKGSDLQLSIIPEYTYWTRDSNNMIHRCNVPQGIKLNICIQKGYDSPEGMWYRSEMFIELSTEEEFYDFMIGIQKEFCNKQELV